MKFKKSDLGYNILVIALVVVIAVLGSLLVINIFFRGGSSAYRIQEDTHATEMQPDETANGGNSSLSVGSRPVTTASAANADEPPAENALPAESAPAEEQTEDPASNYDPDRMLVNAKNPLSKDYAPPNLTTVKGQSYKLAAVAATALEELLAGAKADGITGLTMFSGYRTYERQQTLYNNKVAQYKNEYGDKAGDKAATVVARPGTSEHQSGYAADVALSKLVQSFGKTEQGIWLHDNCARYGFIIRYPKDKESVTGVIYEPWHLRYVGPELAPKIMESGLCLEEYFQEHMPELDYQY
jgi:D-alanyl-D-alanine carboxypeptidase